MMRAKLIFAAAALAMCLVACEKKSLVPIILKNVTAQCCGVSNPTDSLQWLNENMNVLISANSNYEGFEYFAYHYVDTIEQSDIVVVYCNSDAYYSDDCYYYHWAYIYNCEGSILASGPYNFQSEWQGVSFTKKQGAYPPPEPCTNCDSIFNRLQYVEMLCHVKIGYDE